MFHCQAAMSSVVGSASTSLEAARAFSARSVILPCRENWRFVKDGEFSITRSSACGNSRADIGAGATL